MSATLTEIHEALELARTKRLRAQAERDYHHRAADRASERVFFYWQREDELENRLADIRKAAAGSR